MPKLIVNNRQLTDEKNNKVGGGTQNLFQFISAAPYRTNVNRRGAGKGVGLTGQGVMKVPLLPEMAAELIARWR